MTVTEKFEVYLLVRYRDTDQLGEGLPIGRYYLGQGDKFGIDRVWRTMAQMDVIELTRSDLEALLIFEHPNIDLQYGNTKNGFRELEGFLTRTESHEDWFGNDTYRYFLCCDR